MELLVKPEMLTSYTYGLTFGNAETVSFYLLHNVSTLNQCREVSCVTFVCKHFASILQTGHITLSSTPDQLLEKPQHEIPQAATTV